MNLYTKTVGSMVAAHICIYIYVCKVMQDVYHPQYLEPSGDLSQRENFELLWLRVLVLTPSPPRTYYLGTGALKRPLRPYYLGTWGARVQKVSILSLVVGEQRNSSISGTALRLPGVQLSGGAGTLPALGKLLVTVLWRRPRESF